MSSFFSKLPNSKYSACIVHFDVFVRCKFFAMYTGIIAGSTINLTATPHAYTNPVAATTVTNTSSGNNNILLLSLPTNHKNDKSVTVLGGGDGLTHY